MCSRLRHSRLQPGSLQNPYSIGRMSPWQVGSVLRNSLVNDHINDKREAILLARALYNHVKDSSGPQVTIEHFKSFIHADLAPVAFQVVTFSP